MFRKGFLSSGV